MLVNYLTRLLRTPQVWVPAVFFGLLLLVSIELHRDYGVSWDEPNNHLNGLVTIKYIAKLVVPDWIARQPGQELVPALNQFKDADHGSLFEVFAAVLGYLLTDGDSRSFYFLRHFLIFCGFILGVWALFQLGKIRYRSWKAGMLASILLVISPRIFAEAFYNGKDILYMSFFTLAVYTLVLLLQRPTLNRAVLHALATALAVDIRVQGVQLLFLTLLLLLVTAQITPARTGTDRPPYIRLSICYIIVTLSGILLGWPYLWTMSLADLLTLLPRMGQYPWVHTNLYRGQLLPVSRLPWHYISVWILITTPLTYTLAAATGVVSATVRLSQLGRARLRAFNGRFDVVLLLWFLGPLTVVGILHTAVYEGWRHLYFIYPALLLFTVGSLRALWRIAHARQHWAWVILSFVTLEMMYTALRMVCLHPYENVYFSFLPPSSAERLFERDYWGLSYYQGLKWLMRYDPAARLTINVPWHHPLYNNSLLLLPADRARIQYVPLRQAHYYITHYRWHPQTYADSVGREIYSIRAEGVKILSIFDTTVR